MSNGSRSTSASERLARTDRVFLALGHATRRQILFFLKLHGGPMTAGSIAERFSCRWPTVSRHLSVLERAGLVLQRPRGRERVYRLNERELTSVTGDWLNWFSPAARRGLSRGRKRGVRKGLREEK